MEPTKPQQAESGASSAAERFTDGAPTSVDQVAATLAETLGDAWSGFVGHLPLIGVSLVVLALTVLISKLFQRFSHRLLDHGHMRESLQELVERLVVGALWAAGLLLAAMVLFPGLTPAKALGGLGLLSVAVGFAFRDIFENFLAGLLILLRFPFENGDFIECQGIMGRVEEITVRMTYIRLTSGELVVLPNATLFKNPVEVLTDRPKRRVTVMAGVAYDEDVAESVQVIEKAVGGCESVDKDSPIQIFPQGFGASSIDIEVTWWTDPEPVDVRRSRGEVVTAVKAALDDAGIEIPFPYRTLTFKEPLPLQTQGDAAGSDSGEQNGSEGDHSNGASRMD